MAGSAVGAIAVCLAAFGPLTLTPSPALAQSAAPAAGDTLKAEQLDQLVAPIALYPDTLLSQVLIASTYPLEVVEADRWVKQNKGLKGDALKKATDAKTWDDSIKSLAALPDVLTMMSDKLDWTQALGNAVLAQQPDVMDAIQRLRQKAQANDKLKSTKEQKVTVTKQSNKDYIVIEPAVPETLYVPYYDPAIVYGAWPYPAYPPYYFPAPGYIAGGLIATGVVFATGVAVGAWVAHGGWWGGGFNWGNNNININNNVNVNNIRNWQHNPEHRHGVRYNNDGVRQKFAKGDVGNRDQRIDFRGRDGSQVLRPDAGGPGDRRPGADRPGGDRPGIDRPGIDRPGGDRPGGDRPGAGGRPGGDRPNAGNRPGGDRPHAGDRPGGGAKPKPGGGAARPNIPHGGGAFANVDRGGLEKSHSNRGHASRGNRAGGGAPHISRGGGGAPRVGGGGGAARHAGGGRGGGGRRR